MVLLALSLESIGTNTSVGDGKDLVQIFGMVFILVAIGLSLELCSHVGSRCLSRCADSGYFVFECRPKIAAFAMAFRLLAKVGGI